MCSICHMTHCPSACPNAPEEPVFAECENCGEKIYDGDGYYKVGDCYYCIDCVSKETAEVDYYED